MMKEINFDFLKYRYIGFAASLLILIIFLSFFTYKGLNLGLDFTGGVALEVEFESTVSVSQLRAYLKKADFQSSDLTVKKFGSDQEILIESRLAQFQNSKDISQKWANLLTDYPIQSEIKRIDFIGPKIGKELSYSGLLSAIIALILILIYVSFRFEFRFAISAVVALLHDVLFVLGFFALFQISFDLNVLGAVLAIIGYSLNDTIVIFDRVRDRLKTVKKNQAVYSEINQALNQTLSRTIITSLTTLLVLIALLFFGGSSVTNFAIALIVGVIIGTYSSIFIATNILYLIGVRPFISIKKGVNKHDLGNRP